MSNNMVGYDPQKVNTALTKVNTAYSQLITALATDTQKYINTMGSYWACEDAQDFFNTTFKPAIDSLISSTNSTYESINKSVNSAAKAWAEKLKCLSRYSSVSISIQNKKMDTSAILTNIGGVSGIDESQATSESNKLVTILNNAEQALNATKMAIADSGFVGRNQQQSLNTSIDSIKKDIKNATQLITEESKKRIKNTVDAYGTLASDISNAFTAN